MSIHLSLSGWLTKELNFNKEYQEFVTAFMFFCRQSVPRIPPPQNFLQIPEGNQTRQPWSNQMAAQWSNWEDSRQCPVGHPTHPPSLSEFHSNLLQQQDMIPPWPWHEKFRGWKDSGVVSSSMRNWEMCKSHCCCYLYGPCPVAAAGTREIPLRSMAFR